MTALAPMQTLGRFGPGADHPAMEVEDALAYVRALTTSHGENFSVLSRMVPPDLRDDFAAVYAFCRWADDLGDETCAPVDGGEEAFAAGRARALELLGWWREGLAGCFAFARGAAEAAPRHPVFIALAETVRRRSLDEAPFGRLIDAFEQDQRVPRYETWAQVVDYCTRSADPVGRIVLALRGVTDDEAMLQMSDATCTALQLTNFWQDVRRDLQERDRVYLPSAETGLGAGELRAWIDHPDDPSARVRYIRAVRPLVERTRGLFQAGSGLPRAMLADGRAADLAPAVWLFGAGGRSVLRSVERMGCATLWRRPRLGAGRKASLVVAAMGWSAWRRVGRGRRAA